MLINSRIYVILRAWDLSFTCNTYMVHRESQYIVDGSVSERLSKGYFKHYPNNRSELFVCFLELYYRHAGVFLIYIYFPAHFHCLL